MSIIVNNVEKFECQFCGKISAIEFFDEVEEIYCPYCGENLQDDFDALDELDFDE